MTKSTVSGTKLSSAGSTKAGTQGVSDGKSPTMVFVTAALDMSWRLAIVVLVPVIGGFELDKRLNTVPAFSIIGFVVAGAGVAIVLKQMLNQVSQLPAPATSKKDKEPRS